MATNTGGMSHDGGGVANVPQRRSWRSLGAAEPGNLEMVVELVAEILVLVIVTHRQYEYEYE